MTITGAYVFAFKSRSPANILAPVTAPEPNSLEFNMAIQRSGVPGIVDVGEAFSRQRSWLSNFAIPGEGFAGIRWCPSWIDGIDRPGFSEPATADIYRIQRKGASGADQQTLVFTCGPNPAAIPAGDSVVIWNNTTIDLVAQSSGYDLSGFMLPLRSKLAVSASAASEIHDADGRRTVEVNFGTALPAIDFTPSWITAGGISKSTMQLRHWSFYANAATKQLRQPIKLHASLTLNQALPAGGYIILGGNQFASPSYDWSRDYLNFGSTLTEELYRLECEGLADTFGATNPRRLAVELENNPVHSWNTVGLTQGYSQLLKYAFYPIARAAWGQDRTLVVKPPGGMMGLINDFDFPCPVGELAHLAIHYNNSGTLGYILNEDGTLMLDESGNQIIGEGLGVGFSSIEQTDLIASEISRIITKYGYAGGGMTSVGVVPPTSIAEKGMKLGRILTSMTGRGLYTFFYANTDGDPATTYDSADFFTINGERIEALYPEMRPYASRSGLIFT